MTFFWATGAQQARENVAALHACMLVAAGSTQHTHQCLLQRCGGDAARGGAGVSKHAEGPEQVCAGVGQPLLAGHDLRGQGRQQLLS
jgi:hypothetical protein